MKSLTKALALVLPLVAGQALGATTTYYMDSNLTGEIISPIVSPNLGWAKLTLAEGSDGTGDYLDFRISIYDSGNISGDNAGLVNLGDSAAFTSFGFDLSGVTDAVVAYAPPITADAGAWTVSTDSQATGLNSFSFDWYGLDGGSTPVTNVLTFRMYGTGIVLSSLQGSVPPDFALHIQSLASGGSVKVGCANLENCVGDYIPPNPVPVPGAVWLFGSALGMLGWGNRRQKLVAERTAVLA